MNRDDHLNSIAKHFGRLTHEVRALNAIGRFDINSVVEDFIIPVLKDAYDCPDLRNLNEIQTNFPSVDLGSQATKISFQVTSDASSSKVEETLKKFHEHHLDTQFDQIYVLAITEKQSSYKASSLSRTISQLTIPFDPAKHIIDLPDLLSQIKHLDTSALERVDAHLVSGWSERDRHLLFREQLDKFLGFSTNKIEAEKRSRKYIPSIFIETHSTKEEVRLFAHPLFFYRKIQDHLTRYDYAYLNSLMRLAREPEFTLELDRTLFSEAPQSFADLNTWLARVEAAASRELSKIRPLSWWRDDGEQSYSPRNGETAEWSIVRMRAESSASGLTSILRDIFSSIALIRKKIFLVTSMAGQGKTNFVCDLVENQFQPFEIPNLFIPARELNNFAPGNRIFEYISNNRYSPVVTKLHELLKLFNDVAIDACKPFLIVIDGINEVADLGAFSDELKVFCSAICQYDMVKVLITCRSEFFDERFASMLDEPFAAHIHRVSDLRAKMSSTSEIRLLKAYLAHFSVRAQLSRVATDFLKSDLLLLRIFCERHENTNVGYMADIYKGDLFEQYLLKKIRSFPQPLQTRALPTLYRIAAEMLDKNEFAKLSVRSFPADEQETVRRFMEEDIILRQEIDTDSLSGIGDLAISFTYDELRDFVIAYKLVVGDATDDVNKLTAALIALQGRPLYEGVYRYAYLLARKAKDAAAIAACESVPDFAEHFSLNVHLLPPSMQTDDDVERVKALLANGTAPARSRRVALFLLHRRDTRDHLNITILGNHLNGLDSADHSRFVSALFADRYDYDNWAWKKRLHSLINNVVDEKADEGLGRYDSQWLAFFLHVSSIASWSERESVSTMFRENKDEANCRDAIELVRSAVAESVQGLLSDIEQDLG